MNSIAAAADELAFWGTNNKARAFEWGGSISVILLLLLNRAGKRSSWLTSLLVLFLLTSCPTVLFKILRGEFGCWVAFLAIAANLFFPYICPVSRFVLFVIIPDWLAEGLRDTPVGGCFCLIICLLLVIIEIQGAGICSNLECSGTCFVYFPPIFFLYYITILYVIKSFA